MKEKAIDSGASPLFTGFSLLFLIALLTFHFNTKGFELPNTTSWLLVLFYAVNLSSLFWSLNQADAIYESQRVFLFSFCLLFLYAVYRAAGYESQIVMLMTWGLYFSVGYALWDSSFLGTPFLVIFGHKNLLASFIILGLPFCVYLAQRKEGRPKWLQVLLIVLAVLVLIAVGVRSSYLALISGLVAFFLVEFLYGTRKPFTLLFLVVPLVLLLLVPCIPGMERYALFSFSSSESAIERVKLWKKSYHLFLDHPLLGVGAGNWQYNFAKYGLWDLDIVKNKGITFQRPHNDFIWIVTETGSVGALLILAVFGVTAASFHRSQKTSYNSTVTLVFCALIALLADAFFSFDKERIMHGVYAAALFSILLLRIERAVQISAKMQTIAVTVCAVLLLFNVVIGSFRVYGEYKTQQLLIDLSQNKLTEMTIHGRQALSPFYTCDPTSTPIASYIGYAYERMNRADSMWEYSHQANELAPFDYEVLNNYGMLLGRGNNLEAAKAVLLEANRINPNFEATRINLAIISYNSKNYAEALMWLKSLPNYLRDYPTQSAQIIKAASTSASTLQVRSK